MKHILSVLGVCGGVIASSFGAVHIDEEALGAGLGGWRKSGNMVAQYRIADATYRSHRPESTITPDGGIYVSLRIDHVRGWLSSNDHAILEITVNRHGEIVSAQSNIVIQGQSVSSDVMNQVGQSSQKAPIGIDRAVQMGADLVTSLSSKLLKAKVVEPGRVTFPSAVRHNYNLLYQALRVDGRAVAVVLAERAARQRMVPPVAKPVESTPESPAQEAAAPAMEEKPAEHVPLEIHDKVPVSTSTMMQLK